MEAPANLIEKLRTFTDRFSPRTVATYNNNDIMVAKLEGPFHWHKHEETDDFFLVLKGTLDIELRDRTVGLHPGDVFVVPRGVEHRPVARGEVHILLIEPTGTPNTGDKATAAPRILAQGQGQSTPPPYLMGHANRDVVLDGAGWYTAAKDRSR
jgi:mannose-6-phosphate isomerase-like protein (cupin superfamily)